MWRRFYDKVLPGPERVDLAFKMRCFGDVFPPQNTKKLCFHLQKQQLASHADLRLFGHGAQVEEEEGEAEGGPGGVETETQVVRETKD